MPKDYPSSSDKGPFVGSILHAEPSPHLQSGVYLEIEYHGRLMGIHLRRDQVHRLVNELAKLTGFIPDQSDIAKILQALKAVNEKIAGACKRLGTGEGKLHKGPWEGGRE